MSSITAQQTKLDLKLVPWEKRLEIGKCNGRLNPRKKQREPTFQVFLDALALTPCYFAFLTIVDVLEVYMHQLWDSIQKHDTSYRFIMGKKKKIYLNLETFRDILQICPRVPSQHFYELPTDEDIVSFFKELDHIGKSSQSPMLLLIRCITLGELLLLSSTEAYLERQPVLTSFVFLELKSIRVCTTRRMWTMFYYFGKISVITLTTKVTKSKRRCTTLDLPKLSFSSSLSKTRQTYKEVKEIKRPAKKYTNAPTSVVVIRDTPVMSLSKKKERVTIKKSEGIDLLFELGRDKDDSNNDHDSSSEGNDQESDNGYNKTQSDNEKGSDSEHETDETKLESKVENKVEGDEDKGMDYTTNWFDDDVDVRLNKPVSSYEGFIQKEGTDAEMINVQQGNENLEITLNHVIEDAYVTICTATKKTEVPVTSSSHSSDLASKFLKFSYIPHTDAKIVSPMDVHVHHESTYEAAASLTKFEIKKILINKMDESQSYLIATEHRECYDGLIKSYNLDKNRGLTKRKTNKDVEPKKGLKAKISKSGSSKDTMSQLKSYGKFVHAEELEFEVVDSKMPQDQEENLGDDDEEPKRNVVSKRDWFTKPKQPQEPTDPDWNVGKTPQQGPTQIWLMTLVATTDKPSKTFDELMSTPIVFFAYIINECYKTLSKKRDWENPEGGDYPFDLTKPLPLVMNRNLQIVPVDYFFNNLKYLQGGNSTMTYTTSITKTKAAQYDFQVLKTRFQTFGVLLKSLMINIQRKTFYGYARDLESSHDVYSTKRILAMTWVEVMGKHGYGFLREPKNRLTNLSGNDVSDFAIALRMKRDPYTPYQDPQGFIYVENKGRNRLMRSDKLFKYSDGTSTWLRTSLDDVAKNIRMEYLPQRRWSSLEKKRAHIMIKAIDKQLKERRMIRSFEKFVGGRH
uniref:Uncharacterized protein n=1 Tax=Tanacetum cinerariifolium TaxID=118510 RepID=A0A6L2NU29_TANCI|nr:hypothetical protein [Tanacetum cinerariifolium]